MPQPPKLIEPNRSPVDEHSAPPMPAAPNGESLLGKLSCWRKSRVTRQALRLAGEPSLVLNFPKAAELYRSILTGPPNRLVLSTNALRGQCADTDASLELEVINAIHSSPPPTLAIALGENAVDAIFCMDLLQQIPNQEQRMTLLRELHHITRDTLIVSLWVDGNVQAWRHNRRQRPPSQRPYPRRCGATAQTYRATVTQRRFQHSRLYRPAPALRHVARLCTAQTRH